ncbi:MAG TPA: VOC family protein [Candidatus Limnocylindrales bacterium]|nr:VOC family protein [Candidatus Limnocylindrales bacterium]
MKNDIDVLHHLGIISRNMEAAVRQYEQLGFLFTPLTIPRIQLRAGANPEPIGAGNRCAIFRNNYLEVLGIVDASRWASITRQQRGPFDLDEPLQRYEGLHVLHLGTNDLDPVRDRLARSGLQPTEIRPFQRLVDTTDGPKMMKARSLSFPHGRNPEALVQIAQHETPEVVLQPRYMSHPNGALSITEVIVCVQDPDEVAKKYGLYTDQPVQRRGALRVVEFEFSRIIVVSPNDLQEVLPGQVPPTVPFLAGFTVASDLAVTERALKEREINFRVHGGRILVNAADGYGAAVLFESADTKLPVASHRISRTDR